jgi:hypothetical protein
LLRSQAADRPDLSARLAAAKLPDRAAALIRRVVGRTRLWRHEKDAVADELIAHFADGLEAGAAAEELVSGFGGEAEAARLIRRAKIRNRPLIWQGYRVLCWGVAALVVFYVGLAGVFYSGSPFLATDYVARLNEPIEKVPANQRAWPLYRQAILGLWPDGLAGPERTRIDQLMPEKPRADLTAGLAQWLTSHAQALELVRQASLLPSMGFLLGPGGSAYDPELWPQRPAASAATTQPSEQPLIAILLPHLSEVRELARLIDADARLAQQQKDSPRLVRDIHTMLGMSHQITGGTLIESLVGVGISNLALQRIEAVLETSREQLSNGDLTELAHLLSGPTVTADLVGMETERMLFADVLQRTYTDDGAGDGRLTPEGVRFLASVSTISSEGGIEGYMPDGGVLEVSIGPAAMMVMASRREVQTAYDQFMDASEAQLRRPAREADWRTVNSLLEQWHASTLAKTRYLPLALMSPTMQRLSTRGERYLGRRDGVLIGIGLELYRRQHGAYPKTLAELSPAVLPQVPVDRITGGPLRYTVLEGQPMIYSVGADRDDDGGRVPAFKGPGHEGDPYGAAEWNRSAKPLDGDWPLFGML